MADLGSGFTALSGAEQAAVRKAIEVLTRLYPEVTSDLQVSQAFGSVTLNVKAAAGRDFQIQNDMMGPITDIMLDSGVLIVLLVTRRD